MRAYASASGGVMFVPDEVERTIPKVVIRSSNDNDGEGDDAVFCPVDDRSGKS